MHPAYGIDPATPGSATRSADSSSGDAAQASVKSDATLTTSDLIKSDMTAGTAEHPGSYVNFNTCCWKKEGFAELRDCSFWILMLDIFDISGYEESVNTE